MNVVLAEYLRKTRQYLDPRRAEDTLAELADAIQSEVEEAARREGRDPGDEDYRAALARLGEPAKVAARYSDERCLISSANYRPFFGYLGLAFALHLGVALLGLSFFPAGTIDNQTLTSGDFGRLFLKFLSSLPGIFLFDFGLVALVVWQLERHGVQLPFLKRIKDPLPGLAVNLATFASEAVFLVILNEYAGKIIRAWWVGNTHSYELLGPGFYVGLPLLNLAIVFTMVIHLTLLALRNNAAKRTLLLANGFVGLICLGLFFAQRDIFIFPAALDLPSNLGTVVSKSVSIPIMLILTFDVGRKVLALWQEKLG